MNPRVSVVIRTYNRAHLLGEAIESVLGQTIRDLELIVVDDGSTDETPDLLDRYSGRIRAVFLAHTANPAAVFNAGIRLAQGEYVAFLDSDDIWLPDKLARQLESLESDSRFGFAYGNLRLLYQDGRLSAPALSPAEIVKGSVLRTMVRNMCIHPSTVVVRREWFDRRGLFDESIPICEDFFFFLDLARLTDAVGISKPMSLIRQHPGQISTRWGLRNYESAIDALEGLLRHRDLPTDVRLEAHRSIARYHTHLAKALIETGRITESRSHIVRALWRYPLHPPAWRWGLRAFLARTG